MLETIEAAANLHRIAVDLNNEGRKHHAQVLLKTIKLELEQIYGRKEDGEVQGRAESEDSKRNRGWVN